MSKHHASWFMIVLFVLLLFLIVEGNRNKVTYVPPTMAAQPGLLYTAYYPGGYRMSQAGTG